MKTTMIKILLGLASERISSIIVIYPDIKLMDTNLVFADFFI